MNKFKKLFGRARSKIMLAFCMALALLPVAAHAAVDAEATDVLTDITSFFTSVKGFVFLVVGVGLTVGYLKWTKRGR